MTPLFAFHSIGTAAQLVRRIEVRVLAKLVLHLLSLFFVMKEHHPIAQMFSFYLTLCLFEDTGAILYISAA